MYKCRNIVNLCGTIETTTEQITQNLYNFTLQTKRLSGAIDHLAISYTDAMAYMGVQVGQRINLKGTFNAYLYEANGKIRTNKMVNIESLSATTNFDSNRMEVSGEIVSDPIFRTTPFGRNICELNVCTGLYYGKELVVPTICWEDAALMAAELKKGSWVETSGRLQSREYGSAINNGKPKLATEYSVKDILKR